MARAESPDVMQLFLKYLEGTCEGRTPEDVSVETYGYHGEVFIA